jgi:hypothetical protein
MHIQSINILIQMATLRCPVPQRFLHKTRLVVSIFDSHSMHKPVRIIRYYSTFVVNCNGKICHLSRFVSAANAISEVLTFWTKIIHIFLTDFYNLIHNNYLLIFLCPFSVVLYCTTGLCCLLYLLCFSIACSVCYSAWFSFQNIMLFLLSF